jgi:hypothetical protein
MARTTDILNLQLDSLAEQAEAWKKDHDAAMACRDLEEVIAFGNYVFERIRAMDEEWSAEARAAGTMPSEGDAKAVANLYDKWRHCARIAMSQAAVFEKAGHMVKGADRLREFCREVDGILSVPAERLLQAAQHVREGRTRPLGEVRDELLRRFGAGS